MDRSAIYPLDCACSGCHWPHPEDAVAFPLALVRVDCHSIEACHLGDRFAQQISPQFTVYKHHHWRLVQLTVLKSQNEKISSILCFTYDNIFTYRYFSKYTHIELVEFYTLIYDYIIKLQGKSIHPVQFSLEFMSLG